MTARSGAMRPMDARKKSGVPGYARGYFSQIVDGLLFWSIVW